MATDNNPIKKQQRFDSVEQDVETKITPATTFAADEVFVEEETLSEHELEITLTEHIDSVEQLNAALSSKGSGKRAWLGKACLLGVLLIAVVETVLGLYDALIQSTWLFSLYAVVVTLVVSWAAKVSFTEWRKLKMLKKVEDTQTTGMRLLCSMQMGAADPFIDKLLSQLPKSAHTERYMQQVSVEHNDAEKLVLFEATVLTERDLAAKKIVRRFAQESALLLAASPLAVLDMAIILWRNQSMINQLAKCYGIELGYWSRIKLIRGILTNIIYAGTSEIVTDLGTQLLSVEMSGKLSARLGQGLGGGLLTARLGYQAMALCRPLEFNEQTKPKLKGIHKELLLDLKELSSMVLTKTSKMEKQAVSGK
ncbi:TIGR01620 family protein [Shewanella sp. KX20019]|uniref:TIGR01620 family protein n=1 Tax=Shewanella sp. KX20019 TaxID=2803864 RepID=UPI0019295E4B|nr:TIGR01620 family protein [Shewanella sp. KX20019]QQX78840.1 TIGR01620 family protein [Shewanella sp. KX20019]